MKRLFIIDTMALIYRSFFAIGGSQLTSKGGFPTTALYGVALSIKKILHDENPDYLVFVTDSPQKSFRHEIYPEYKAHRSAMPEDLSQQIPVIYELCRFFSADVYSVSGVEADDVIASVAKAYATPDCHVYIVSGDKDFMQCVNENVFLYTTKKNQQHVVIGENEVFERFKCRPNQVVDCLALMGDKSDNVPGVSGIGEKTAASLIEQFGDLDGVYNHLEDISAKGRRDKLLAHKNDAYLSRKLVSIKQDVTLPFVLNDLQHSPKQLQTEKVAEFLRAYDIRLFSENLPDVQLPIDSVHSVELMKRSLNSRTEFDEFVKSAINTTVAIAIETDGLDRLTSKIQKIFLSLDTKVVFEIDVVECSREITQELFSEQRIHYVTYGAKLVLHFFRNTGIKFETTLHDVKIADYLLDANLSRRQFVDVLNRHLSHAGALEESADDYTNRDAIEKVKNLSALWEVLLQRLHDEELWKLYENVELPLVKVLVEMEYSGMPIDVDFLFAYSDELAQQYKKTEAQLFDEAGAEFNINSPKQLRTILYEKLKIPDRLGIKNIKKTKTGLSTDESVLVSLSDHPVPRLVLACRSINKLKGTYVDALPQHVHPNTHRLHTQLHQTKTATGRLSSDHPNLQNIPMRTPMGREIRRAFRPDDDDKVIVSADYSQVEIRLLAHLADAKDLITAFENGLDIHTVTAAKIFNITEDEVDSSQRNSAKAINFGIIYGMGPQRLAREIGVSIPKAKEFIERYFMVYPKIKEFTANLIIEAEQKGYTTTIMGRRRIIEGINDKNFAVRSRAENMAVNSPIQGSAADIIKVAMVNILAKFHEKNMAAKMLLQVHDELIFECDKSQLEQTIALVKYEMENAVPTKVPLVVEVGYGQSWFDAH